MYPEVEDFILMIVALNRAKLADAVLGVALIFA